jgi:hypothetical protein
LTGFDWVRLIHRRAGTPDVQKKSIGRGQARSRGTRSVRFPNQKLQYFKERGVGRRSGITEPTTTVSSIRPFDCACSIPGTRRPPVGIIARNFRLPQLCVCSKKK